MSLKVLFLETRTEIRRQWRSLHTCKQMWKKKYDFDLKSVIDFKAETASLFGSPRKPTKTGKLKKRRTPLYGHMQEHLKILSEMSNSQKVQTHFDASSGYNNCKRKILDEIIPDDILVSSFPPPDAVPVMHGRLDGKGQTPKEFETVTNGHENTNFDEVFISSLPPPNAVLVREFYDNADHFNGMNECSAHFNGMNECSAHKYDREPLTDKERSNDSISQCKQQPPRSKEMKSNASASLQDDTAQDEVHIPKLNPIPVSPQLHVKRRRNLDDHSPQDSEFSFQHFSTQCTLLDVSDNSATKQSLQELNVVKETAMDKKNLNSASCSTWKSSLSDPPFPTKPNDTKSSHLVVDPPTSFDFISTFPLSPKACENDVDRQKQLEMFKTHFQQLSFRYPPSVKGILNKTMPAMNKFFLNRWRQRMIAELGEEGFKLHQDATIQRGINVHANIMEYLTGKRVEDIDILPDNEGHWASLQSVIQIISDVKAVEVEVLHSALMYKGIFDCVARYKDLLCLIDWKVSKKPRPHLKNTYDDPLQVAAYVGALNFDEKYARKFGELNHGMLVIVYPDGSPAHIHVLNKMLLDQYWLDWTHRLQEYFSSVYMEKMAPKSQNKT